MVTDDTAQERDAEAHLRAVSKHDMLCQRRREYSLLIVCRLAPAQRRHQLQTVLSARGLRFVLRRREKWCLLARSTR